MWDGPGALRQQDDFKSHQKQVGSQPLHPVLLQAWLKPIQKQLRLVAALESGCPVSFIEPFFYYSRTLFDYSLESCCADFAIFFFPISFPCGSIFSIPQRCLCFDHTFYFSDLERGDFPDHLSPFFLKPTVLWTLFVL